MNSISFIFVALFIASLQFTYGMDSHYKKEIKAAGKKCRDKFDVPENTLKKMIKLKAKLESDEEKCFAGCVFERLKIIKDGSYDSDYHKSKSKKLFKKKGSIKKANKVFDTCGDEVKNNSNKCKLGYNIQKCLTAQSKKVGLKPAEFD